jgi:hypothetical protein
MDRGDNHMTVPKETWKIIGDAREYYSSLIHSDFKEMDDSEKASWLEITDEIEHHMKIAKMMFEQIENESKANSNDQKDKRTEQSESKADGYKPARQEGQDKEERKEKGNEINIPRYFSTM